MKLDVAEKDTKEYLAEAENILKAHGVCTLVGKSRDTVKAVDIAEELKLKGFSIGIITLHTESVGPENEKRNISILSIEVKK